MIRLRLFTIVCGAGLFVAGGVAISGCGGDPEQPSRESISAPRKGGGVQSTADEKIKPKAGDNAKK